jgi:hypothetical protein
MLAERAGFELSVHTVVERRGSPKCSRDRQMVDILSAVLTDTVELFVSQSPARQGGEKTGNGAQLVIKGREEVVIGIKVCRASAVNALNVWDVRGPTKPEVLVFDKATVVKEFELWVEAVSSRRRYDRKRILEGDGILVRSKPRHACMGTGIHSRVERSFLQTACRTPLHHRSVDCYRLSGDSNGQIRSLTESRIFETSGVSAPGSRAGGLSWIRLTFPTAGSSGLGDLMARSFARAGVTGGSSNPAITKATTVREAAAARKS